MTAYCYYPVEPPTKWQAGTSGEAQVPFYFDCAPRFTDVGVMRTTDGFFKSAMFCSACYSERLAQQAAKMEAMQA